MNGISNVLQRIESIQKRVKEIQPMRVKEITAHISSVQGEKFQKAMNTALGQHVENTDESKAPATKASDNVKASEQPVKEKPASGENIKALIKEASKQYGVPESLISSVIRTESAFNPKAVSRAGAMGLMQLMPQTAKQYGVTDAFNPKQNIFAGTKHLRELMDQFKGSLPLSLAAYNAGAKRVIDSKGIPNITETKNYVKSVINHYQKIKDLK